MALFLLVEHYNERKEDDVLLSEVYEEMAEHLTNLISLKQRQNKSSNKTLYNFVICI